MNVSIVYIYICEDEDVYKKEEKRNFGGIDWMGVLDLVILWGGFFLLNHFINKNFIFFYLIQLLFISASLRVSTSERNGGLHSVTPRSPSERIRIRNSIYKAFDIINRANLGMEVMHERNAHNFPLDLADIEAPFTNG
ncbi:hypothetical protein L6452_00420 [Arctium lappa]|uniref:Uncharacterized protein n=1 Tax=Arctium lappa TaxID=4217 RepID=A0ACB9FDF9_ARCLA|nr:hypothetical protein L6452_00420 [Arctium lappa]